MVFVGLALSRETLAENFKLFFRKGEFMKKMRLDEFYDWMYPVSSEDVALEVASEKEDGGETKTSEKSELSELSHKSDGDIAY
jgi:hypothetical protein